MIPSLSPSPLPLPALLTAGAVSSAVPPAPRTADGDCDCLPLWECMQKGGDCSRLKTSLEACLAAKKAGQ